MNSQNCINLTSRSTALVPQLKLTTIASDVDIQKQWFTLVYTNLFYFEACTSQPVFISLCLTFIDVKNFRTIYCTLYIGCKINMKTSGGISNPHRLCILWGRSGQMVLLYHKQNSLFTRLCRILSLLPCVVGSPHFTFPLRCCTADSGANRRNLTSQKLNKTTVKKCLILHPLSHYG